MAGWSLFSPILHVARSTRVPRYPPRPLGLKLELQKTFSSLPTKPQSMAAPKLCPMSSDVGLRWMSSSLTCLLTPAVMSICTVKVPLVRPELTQ